jgi:PAS domain S-box-containing protein
MIAYIRNLKIRPKLLLGYLTAFVLSLGLGGLILYPAIEEIIRKNTESELSITTKTIRDMVKASADASIKNYLRAIAEKSRDVVSYYARQSEEGLLTREEAQERAGKVLLSQTVGETGYIFVWDGRRAPRSIPLAVHPVIQGQDVAYVDFVQEGVKKKRGYMEYKWKNPGEKTARDKAMYLAYFEPWKWIIAVSSYREEFRQLINVDYLRESVLSIRFGQTGYSYIIDTRGNVIIHPQFVGNVYDVKDSAGRFFIREMCEKRNGKIVYNWKNPSEERPRQKLAIFSDIPEFGWIVVSTSYLSEFYEPLNRVKTISFGLFVAALGFLFLLTIWYGSYIANSARRLVDAFRAASTGDFAVRIANPSGDEFGSLSRYFNDFMEKLERYNQSLQQEVQDRRQAEEALRQSEEKYRNIFENALEGIFQSTPKGRIVSGNPALARMFGYASAEEMTMSIRNIGEQLYVRVEDRKRFMETLEGQGLVEGFEVEQYTRDGGIIWVSFNARAVRDEDGKNIFFEGICQDITERKRAEEERARLESQLLQSQKMEAVGQLAGGIAHDFNNILTALIGYASLLKTKMDKDEPLRGYVDHILSSSEKAANLTQSLLAFSRKQVMELKPYDVNLIIKRIESLLKRLLTEDIELKTVLTGQNVTAVVDVIQMDQVLLNLATNARDAMPAGGKLVIETRPVEIDGGFVKKHGYGEPGRYVQISVSDTGLGMDRRTKEKIFEPFFTTKGMGKGTGLGLSIVYGIIKQHGGFINFYSEPGHGTTFRIYIPAAQAGTEEESHPVVEVRGGVETILLAEDNHDARELVREVLSSAGYDVVEALDGEDALQKFLEHRDGIDLLILDVVMPRKNGVETFNEIRKLRSDMKVLFTSGYTGDLVIDKGMDDQVFDFISKPSSPKDLLIKVRAILDR